MHVLTRWSKWKISSEQTLNSGVYIYIYICLSEKRFVSSKRENCRRRVTNKAMVEDRKNKEIGNERTNKTFKTKAKRMLGHRKWKWNGTCEMNMRFYGWWHHTLHYIISCWKPNEEKFKYRRTNKNANRVMRCHTPKLYGIISRRQWSKWIGDKNSLLRT